MQAVLVLAADGLGFAASKDTCRHDSGADGSCGSARADAGLADCGVDRVLGCVRPVCANGYPVALPRICHVLRPQQVLGACAVQYWPAAACLEELGACAALPGGFAGGRSGECMMDRRKVCCGACKAEPAVNVRGSKCSHLYWQGL